MSVKSDSKVFYKCGLAICRSCTNTSTAKYAFPFPKAPRFGIPADLKEAKLKKEKDRQRELELRKEEKEKEKNHLYFKHDFYYLPSTLNKRYTKFEKPNKYKDEQKAKLSRFQNYTDIVLEREKNIEIKRQKLDEENAKKKKEELEELEKKDYKQFKKYYISLMGENVPSKFRSNKATFFGLKCPVKDSRNNYPGPGSYILPSDFGVYYPKDYPEENVYVEKKPEFEEKAWRHGMKKIKPKEENKMGNDKDENERENNEEEERKENEREEEGTKEEGTKEEGTKEEGTKEEGTKEEGTKKEGTKEEGNKKEGTKEEGNKEEGKKEADIPSAQEDKAKKEENKEKDEDKESECMLLRDILVYNN